MNFILVFLVSTFSFWSYAQITSLPKPTSQTVSEPKGGVNLDLSNVKVVNGKCSVGGVLGDMANSPCERFYNKAQTGSTPIKDPVTEPKTIEVKDVKIVPVSGAIQ
jgi:hypothetical protein